MNKSSEIILNTPNLNTNYDFLTPELHGIKNDSFGSLKSPLISKFRTPLNTKPKNRNRRSFTPSKLNMCPTPEISPIANNRSLKSINNNYNSINNDLDTSSFRNNSAFLEESVLLSSPSFIDGQLKDVKNSSNILLPKKMVLRRVLRSNNQAENSFKLENNADQSFSPKSLKFTSTPDINEINRNKNAIKYQKRNVADDLMNNSDFKTSDTSTVDFSNCSNGSNISFNLSGGSQITPKVDLNKCITVSSVLIGIGLRKYVRNFKKQNFTLTTFMNLNNSDLIKYGVRDANDRRKILQLFNFEIESPNNVSTY